MFIDRVFLRDSQLEFEHIRLSRSSSCLAVDTHLLDGFSSSSLASKAFCTAVAAMIGDAVKLLESRTTKRDRLIRTVFVVQAADLSRRQINHMSVEQDTRDRYLLPLAKARGRNSV